MKIKQDVIPRHTHTGSGGEAEPIENHHQRHEVGGPDEIIDIDASHLTYGTLDGDRLPAISTTKKGAVPATGTPADKFLGDDGTFQRVVQADVDGLKTTDTPQFAGMGIGTPGSANHINLIHDAVIGISGGPIQTFNDGDKQLEISGCDHIIGDGPATGLPGNGDFELIYPETSQHSYGSPLVSCDGFLYLGMLVGGGGTIKKWSGSGTSWSTVYSPGSTSHITGGIKYQDHVFFCTQTKIHEFDGANWSSSDTPYFGVDFCEYGGALYMSGDYGRVSRKIGSGAWSEVYENDQFPDYGSYVHRGARFTLHNGSMFSAWYTSKPEVKILKFDGTSWSVTKTFSETGQSYVPIISFGAYMYVGIGAKVYRSSDGTTWSEVGAGTFTTTNYCFFDWDGVLLVLGNDNVYKSTDGVNFTHWKTINGVRLLFAVRHGGVVYVGGYDYGSPYYTRVYSLTELGYTPACNGKIWGDLRLMQRFMPNGAAGVLGSLLTSGETTYPTWLPTGAAGTYLAGGTTPSYADFAAAALAAFKSTVAAKIVCHDGEIVVHDGEVVYGT